MDKHVLSLEESQELLKVLKARFEKHMDRHEGMDWKKIQAKLEANPKKLWSLDEMESTDGEPDVIDTTNKQTNTCFVIVLQKVPKDDGVYVTTWKHGTHEKNINLPVMFWNGRKKWELSFLQKSNTANCSVWGNSIPKHPVGSKHPRKSGNTVVRYFVIVVMKPFLCTTMVRNHTTQHVGSEES